MRTIPEAKRDDDYIIQLTDIRKSFGVQDVLKGVNLKIRRGETMVVIGTSGGGKSVILKHCIGLLQPDHGEVKVDDIEKAVRRRAAGEHGHGEGGSVERKFPEYKADLASVDIFLL